MDIYPEDLGTGRQIALLRLRAATFDGGSSGSAGHAPTEPRMGILGQWWTRGTRLPPQVAAASFDAMQPKANIMAGVLAAVSMGFLLPAGALACGGRLEPAAGLALWGALMATLGVTTPGLLFRRLSHRPVRAEELEALKTGTDDPLEAAFLRLALDAGAQRVSSDTADGVRSAMRALGEAIDRLPAVNAPRTDVDTMRAEVARALTEARQESDAVIAASQRRRAEALQRSADTAELSQTLIRRSAALRDEIMAQIESLHLGLTAFQTQSGDVAGLAQLADSVRAVATEAASVGAARAELDAAIEAPRRAATAEGETVPLRNNAR